MSKGKTIEVTVPEGYEIGKVEFVKINKVDKLPEKWEDIGKLDGYFIDNVSDMVQVTGADTNKNNKNLLVTKKLAEATLARIQLMALVHIYNDGEELDWGKNIKYCIVPANGTYEKSWNGSAKQILAFKTEELRDEFFNAPDIQKLMEIAYPAM